MTIIHLITEIKISFTSTRRYHSAIESHRRLKATEECVEENKTRRKF